MIMIKNTRHLIDEFIRRLAFFLIVLRGERPMHFLVNWPSSAFSSFKNSFYFRLSQDCEWVHSIVFMGQSTKLSLDASSLL